MTDERPIVVLVGDGVCRRAGELTHGLDPRWQLLRYDVDGDAQTVRRARAAIAMPAALDWRQATPHLKFLQLPGAGTDELDVGRLPVDCLISNVYEHEASVAEYVFTCVLRLEGSWLTQARSGLREGMWRYSDRIGEGPRPSLCGKRFGVIGFGRIGRRCAAVARSFNMDVVAFTRQPPTAHGPDGDAGFVRFMRSVDELLAVSDYVLVACPLTPATRGLLDRRRLGRMQPGTVLINVARAEVVDEQALFEALAQRRLRGAVLDVWYQYPQGTSEPGSSSTMPFHELDNVIATPHLSANTEDTVRCRWAFMRANLNRLLRGEAVLNRVMPGQGAGEASLVHPGPVDQMVMRGGDRKSRVRRRA